MFAYKGKLHIKRGFFQFKKFYQSLRKHESQYPADFVIHMRLSTSGGRTANNCHPFKINKNVAFVHNGILSKYDYFGLKQNHKQLKSDTALYCEDLSKYPIDFLEKPKIVNEIEIFAKKEHSKFIFMDNKGKVYISNESSGHWSGGIWFSSGWAILETLQTVRDYDDESTDWVECVYCGSYVESHETLVTVYGPVCSVCLHGGHETKAMTDFLRPKKQTKCTLKRLFVSSNGA